MIGCYFNETVRELCPLPCQRKVYMGISGKAHGYGKAAPANAMIMTFKFNTMDIEERNEVFIQELPFFIGTFGGSLGLFIGFSFTCFFEKIINYFIKAK